MIILKATECPVLKKSACPNYRSDDIDSCIGETYDDRPPLPCGEITASGGGLITTNRHDLGAIPGVVTINYDMFSAPDKLEVFIDGVLKATTVTFVSGTGTLNFYYSGSGIATVVVSSEDPGTVWEYLISCPI